MIHITHSHPEGVYYYMIFNLAAILIGVVVAGIAAHKSKYSGREFAAIVASGILFLVIGSKLILFDSSHWLSLVYDGYLPLDNGKSIVGAIIGGMFGAWAAGRFLGKRGSVLDLCAVSFPLALAVQRLGCLFAGCCHGIVTSVPWGITYGPESRPFIEQQQLGMIPADAATSLAMHPDQIYNIIACLIIAIIAWKTGARWKSTSGKFLFSVILYLVFRFVEEFTRFSLHPEAWMGLKVIQWKALATLIPLSLLLFFRERNARKVLHVDISVQQPLNNVKALLISLFVLVITFHVGGWLSVDERTIIMITVLPLSGFVVIDTFLRTIFSKKYIRSSSLFLFAFILMSQKADKPIKPIKPMPAPESYTSFNLTTGAGKFGNDHEFNHRTEWGEDCEGNLVPYETSDKIGYRHSYKIGGIGISRKVYYNQWRSLLASLNVYAGREKLTPIDNPNISFDAPTFNNTLLSINPMLQYDGRAIGLGIGGSFGILGHDIPDNPSDDSDYNPKTDVRKASLQWRVRIFSERFSFIEALGGYDLGSTGDYNLQLLYGTRFNGNKYMMKTGLAWSKHGGRSFVLHGQMRLSPRLFLSPQLMFGNRNYSGPTNIKSNRFALGIEYRINDK